MERIIALHRTEKQSGRRNQRQTASRASLPRAGEILCLAAPAAPARPADASVTSWVSIHEVPKITIPFSSGQEAVRNKSKSKPALNTDSSGAPSQPRL